MFRPTSDYGCIVLAPMFWLRDRHKILMTMFWLTHSSVILMTMFWLRDSHKILMAVLAYTQFCDTDDNVLA